MIIEKYNPNSLSVSAILGLIASGDIAIPEIQRPFVWKKTQVRDLLDSLYKGYPTGYLIIWKNHNVKLKDGSVSAGKKILIDGQQRVTALMTAIAGIPVVNAAYKKERIKIAFNPFEALSEDKDAEIFAVQDQSHLKGKKWIPDVAEIFKNEFSTIKFAIQYCQDNPEMDIETLDKIITNLRSIGNRLIGVIELSENLDIDIVTDIFIRINSKGTALSQGDFVMSKIAADEDYGGNMLRKAIDYFAHLCVEPNFYDYIKDHDIEFCQSEYMQKLAWLKNDKESVYDPECDDKNIDLLPYFRAIMTQQQIDVFYKFTQEDGPRKGEKYGEERLFKSSLEARANQRYYIQCPDGTFAIPPGETLPAELKEGLIVAPLKTDKVWKWIYPRYKQELEAGNIVFKRTTTSGLVDENGKQSKWNIYNKLWLSEQQEKGVVPSNLITDYENRQSAAELKKLNLSFNYAKPVRLIEYMLTISRMEKDAIILDSFAGSGTTAHAVLNMNKADGGNRQFIIVEMGDYADSITAERVKRVINGYGSGKNVVVGTGGNFTFYDLGEPILLSNGNLNENVSVDKIREYVYYMETKEPMATVSNGNPYFMGNSHSAAYYFYYEKDAITTLDHEFLSTIPERADSYIIYADLCTIPAEELAKYIITFKKIPRDIAKL